MMPPSIAQLPAPAVNVEAEQAVLGAILLTSTNVLRPLVLEEGLRAEHFYRERHRLMFAAMVELDGEGSAVDGLTVVAKLRSQGFAARDVKVAVDELVAAVPHLSGVRDHARIVIDQWMWRQRHRAMTEGLAAAARSDEGAWLEAMRLAHQSIAFAPDEAYIGETALADHMWAWLEKPPEPGLPVPAELPSLARMVRFRAGHTTVIGGWSHAGKSFFALQIAAFMGASGHRTVYWTNEDTAEEIGARRLAGLSGISKTAISDRDLTPDQTSALGKLLPGALPLEVVPCHGWDPERVARSIRQESPVVAVVDHLHAMGVGNEEEINRAMQHMTAAAGQTGAHAFLVGQLANRRQVGVVRPRPVAGDLRGSGQVYNLAHTVILVHIDEEEEDGRRVQTGDAWVEVVKNKPAGTLGAIAAVFDQRRLMFVGHPSGRVV